MSNDTDTATTIASTVTSSISSTVEDVLDSILDSKFFIVAIVLLGILTVFLMGLCCVACVYYVKQLSCRDGAFCCETACDCCNRKKRDKDDLEANTSHETESDALLVSKNIPAAAARASNKSKKKHIKKDKEKIEKIYKETIHDA
jgi:hypothetical protein